MIAPAEGAPEGLPRLFALQARWIAYLQGGTFCGGCFFAAASAEFDGRPGPVRAQIAEFAGHWRERLAGDQWLLTVKTAGQSQNGLSRRQEWEAPTTPGTLDFDSLVDDAALAADLMALRPALRALFCTDFQRQRWVIEQAGAQIEVALDQGRIHVPGTDLSDPLLELELELLSGPESALMALADVLRQTPQGLVVLTPSDASKAQRGMALWQRSH